MANKKVHKIFGASLKAKIKFAETFTHNGKKAIKGTLVTSQKQADGSFIDGEVPFTCWAGVFRKADGEGFVDVEVQTNIIYTVEIVGLIPDTNTYTKKGKDGAEDTKVTELVATCSLKPTILEEFEINLRDNAAPASKSAKPAAKAAPAEDDDIPF